MKPLCVALLVALAGCAQQPSVSVAVPVACIEALPARPQVRTEAELLAMDRYARTLATWADRLTLDAYARELEALLAGCAP
jgi:hypothetical protein